jgi:hypothetical protein
MTSRWIPGFKQIFQAELLPPPIGGGRIPFPPLWGEKVLSFLQREERRRPLPFKVERLAEAYHAWLAWPWASQATACGRLRVPTVLATRMPWACEWAVGCAGGRRAPAHIVVHDRVSFRMRALCTARASSLLSLAAKAGDPTSLGEDCAAAAAW